jgi:hypothetical protein
MNATQNAIPALGWRAEEEYTRFTDKAIAVLRLNAHRYEERKGGASACVSCPTE